MNPEPEMRFRVLDVERSARMGEEVLVRGGEVMMGGVVRRRAVVLMSTKMDDILGLQW